MCGKNRGPLAVEGPRRGITPACAGKTTVEHALISIDIGSPPHVREKH